MGDFSTSLGYGYVFHYTNTIGQFISAPQDKLGVDNLVLDYENTDKYIIVARLVAIDYFCQSDGNKASKSKYHSLAFENKIEYILIEKNTGDLQVFLSMNKLQKKMSALLISKDIELDISEKEKFLKLAPLSRIDQSKCIRHSNDT